MTAPATKLRESIKSEVVVCLMATVSQVSRKLEFMFQSRTTTATP